MVTTTCKQCPSTFTKPTESKAKSALLMHVGRKHKRNILSVREGGRRNNGHVVMAEEPVQHRSRSSKLGTEQTEALCAKIREISDNFSNKTACVREALKACGLQGRLQVSSTMVDRYYRKALDDAKSAPKKKQRRIRSVEQADEPSEGLNFCPHCGMNLAVLATALRVAHNMSKA